VPYRGSSDEQKEGLELRRKISSDAKNRKWKKDS
jgi:hypothetical protein